MQNLGYQMTSAITACTSEGQSKRDYKRQHGDTDFHVFGYAYKHDLCDTAKEMGQYIHANYPTLKLIKDIKPEMVQSYLIHKAETCSAATMGKIYAHVRKIDQVITHRYGGGGYRDRISMPAMDQTPKQRDKVMNEMDYNKLLAALKATKSDAWKSCVLSWHAGLRVEETAGVRMDRLQETGGRWGYGSFTILKGDGSKGGRPRTIDLVTPQAREAIKELIKDLQPGQLILQKRDGSKYQSSSITRQISRIAGKLDLSQDYKQNRNHALRKAFAQASYDHLRRTGVSKREALDYASKQLGHGANRTDLANAYISDQW